MNGKIEREKFFQDILINDQKNQIGLIQSKSLGTIQSNIDLAIKNIRKAAKKSKNYLSSRAVFD